MEIVEDGGVPFADLFAQKAPTGSEAMKAEHLQLLRIHLLLQSIYSFHLLLSKNSALSFLRGLRRQKDSHNER